MIDELELLWLVTGIGHTKKYIAPILVRPVFHNFAHQKRNEF